MTEWIIEVNDGQEVLGRDDGLYDVVVSDTFNPFGNFAKGFFDDLEGQLFDLFQRGTKVSFQYSNDNTSGFTQRFVGYVVNDLEQEADGAEQLEIEAHSFDQFLRGDEVTNDQTGNTIFEALEDVITTDIPPVSWDASLVEVQNNIELTQSFQGETVEEFILSVRQKSAGEIFGVTENLEFFFEPSEISRTRRDIDNSQWVTHDIGEEAAETDNQVTVYYSDGNEAVTVDDTGDQLTLQENLAAGGPGQEGTSITRDDITNIEDAIDAGEAYLNGRAATLTGPVTTFDLNSAQPGDVIGITINPRGIEGDFRIAENRMQWRSETNELTVVAKKGADDDILIEQSKTLKRVENRPRDTSIIPDRVTDSLVEGIITVSGDANGVPFEITRVTNNARNKIRDAWINKTTIGVQDIRVSQETNRPSRTDEDISQIDFASPGQSFPTNTSVEYQATLSGTGIRTVGLFDPTNTMLAVGLLPEPVTDPTVTLTIDVDTSPEKDKSALVNSGQTATRDIIADNNPEFVDEYAFGSDTSDAVESDTTLTTVATNELDDLIFQQVSGTSFSNVIVSNPAEKPLTVTSNGLELSQTGFFEEAEDYAITSNVAIIDDVDFSAGNGIQLVGDGEAIEFDFTTTHTIPKEYLFVYYRGRKDTNNGTGDEFRISIDGNRITDGAIFSAANGTNITWDSATFDSIATEFDLTAGTHSVRIQITQENDDRNEFDVFGVADARYIPFPEDNTVHEDNGHLDEPKLYPDTVPVEFNTITTQIPIDVVTLTQTWNDTSEDQELTITPGGSFSNTAQTSIDYTNRVVEVSTSAVLSRYPETTNPQDGTPRFGYNGQVIQSHELSVSLDAIQRNEIGEVLVRSFVGPNTATSETFAEGGQQSDGNLITRARIPEFVKQSTQRVVSSERLRWINDPEN